MSLSSLLAVAACGSDSSGPDENPTGASLQGRVVSFDLGQASVRKYGLASLAEADVTVTVGSRSAQTDAEGRFALSDIPTGDQLVTFSKQGVSGTYLLSDVDEGETFELEGVELSGGDISTSHTGTWVGTGGSTDPGSQGQIALTMVLEKNGNRLSGTAEVGEPDNTVWSIEGTETGLSAEGSFALVSTDSPCATGGDFTGSFAGDTLSASFVEVSPPTGCGTPESGTFRVVKQ